MRGRTISPQIVGNHTSESKLTEIDRTCDIFFIRQVLTPQRQSKSISGTAELDAIYAELSVNQPTRIAFRRL
jgi:hypothetical protein